MDMTKKSTSNIRTKFVLYNFAGQEKAYYLVDRKTLKKPTVHIPKPANILGASLVPPLEETLIKDYNYQVFVSRSAKKINGSSSTIKIIDIKTEDDGIFYKYQKIDKETYNKLTDISVAQTDESVFAFAITNLANGNLNTAKYALISTFDATLIETHAKALTNTEIAKFIKDVESVIFEPDILKTHKILEQMQINDKISLLELVKILEENSHSIIINIKHLLENYQRKGLKRIDGSRDKDGNLIKPELQTENINSGEYVQMGSFEINRNTATINMLISKQVKLVKIEDDSQINDVASLLMTDLINYNSYTIVSDGEVNIKLLKVKISNKQVFNLLKAMGVINKDGIPAQEFDFRCEYDIPLDTLPIVSFTSSYGSIDGIFEELAEIKVLVSIISAYLRESSDVYLSEQLWELKKHSLSKNLYLNFPSTSEYTDLSEAIVNGKIDSRVSYKVDIGSKEILNFSKLHSANKFLERIYEGFNQDTGEKLEKPSFDITLEQNIVFRHKHLSSRTKLTKIDDLMKPIFDDFLGIENNGKVAAILSKVGADSLQQILSHKNISEKVNKDQLVSALTDANNKLNAYAKKVYQEKISPLVLYIGSTGLLPEEMDVKAETAEAIASKYKKLQFSKDEKDGMFFEVGDSILSVYAKNEYYTTNC